jgi:hypothetical protein
LVTVEARTTARIYAWEISRQPTSTGVHIKSSKQSDTLKGHSNFKRYRVKRHRAKNHTTRKYDSENFIVRRYFQASTEDEILRDLGRNAQTRALKSHNRVQSEAKVLFFNRLPFDDDKLLLPVEQSLQFYGPEPLLDKTSPPLPAFFCSQAACGRSF